MAHCEEYGRAAAYEDGRYPAAAAGAGCVTALVATAHAAFTPPASAENLAKTTIKREEINQVRVS